MNYTNLFPELLKQLPIVRKEDVCYHYQRRQPNNDNKTKLFLPYGKKLLLWFLTYDRKRYSIAMEYDEHHECVKKCFFHYLSFKPELCQGCGTLIWCTRMKDQFCLNKIIYLKGEKYHKPLWTSHMIELKYLLENYIHNMHYGSFCSLGLPIITNTKSSSCLLLQATSLCYEVYCILSTTNYRTTLREYMANFRVIPIDIKRDIYDLECKNDNNGYKIYGRALVNDFKTSLFLKQLFRDKRRHYKEIEYSDDEEDKVEVVIQPMILSCVYIPKMKMWKPYKTSRDYLDMNKKIMQIEKKNGQLS